MLLAAAALAVGAFFLLHHPGGPGAPATSANGHGPVRVEDAGVRDRFVRFAVLPRGAPPFRVPRDVRSGSRVVGHLQDGTIFAAPTRDGYWEMFARHTRGGWAGGVPWRVTIKRHPQPPDGWRIGEGGFFTPSGYAAIVSGSTIVGRGAHLVLAYADGTRERIKVIWVSKPIGAGFYYHVVSKAHRTRAHRVVALELRRGGEVVAREVLPTLRLPTAPSPRR